MKTIERDHSSEKYLAEKYGRQQAKPKMRIQKSLVRQIFYAAKQAYQTFVEELADRRQLVSLTQLFDDESVARKIEYDYRGQIKVRDDRVTLPKSLMKEFYRYIANADPYYTREPHKIGFEAVSSEAVATLADAFTRAEVDPQQGQVVIKEVAVSDVPPHTVWDKKWSERFKDAFGHWPITKDIPKDTIMEKLPYWNDMLTFLDKEAEERAKRI